MTLEKIKEMNIPVGTPIELKLNKLLSEGNFEKKLSDNEECKVTGYFHKISKMSSYNNYFLVYHTSTGHRFPYKQEVFLGFIEDIKILEPKK